MMKEPEDSPERPEEKFVLRMPDGMRARVAQEARANHRSMNSQLLLYIEAGLKGLDAGEVAQAIARIELAIANLRRQP